MRRTERWNITRGENQTKCGDLYELLFFIDFVNSHIYNIQQRWTTSPWGFNNGYLLPCSRMDKTRTPSDIKFWDKLCRYQFHASTLYAKQRNLLKSNMSMPKWLMDCRLMEISSLPCWIQFWLGKLAQMDLVKECKPI